MYTTYLFIVADSFDEELAEDGEVDMMSIETGSPTEDPLSLRDFFNMEKVVRRYTGDNMRSNAYQEMEEATKKRKKEMNNAIALCYLDMCLHVKMVKTKWFSLYLCR